MRIGFVLQLSLKVVGWLGSIVSADVTIVKEPEVCTELPEVSNWGWSNAFRKITFGETTVGGTAIVSTEP